VKKKINKALHNIVTPDKDKMRFLYDSKSLEVKKSRSSKVPNSKSSKVQKFKSLEVKKLKGSKVPHFKSSEVKESRSSEVQKLKESKIKDSGSLEVPKFGSHEVQNVKTPEVPKSESPEVQDIKTQAKYETFKKLTVLFLNKDIDTLIKFEREIMQNRDLKTERITKNSILRCLVKILPLIKFNKNKIPDENILMDRILKALEKKLNSQ